MPARRINLGASAKTRVSKLLEHLGMIAGDALPSTEMRAPRRTAEEHLADWVMRTEAPPELLRRRMLEHPATTETLEELPDPQGILPPGIRKALVRQKTAMHMAPDPTAEPGIYDMAETLMERNPDTPLHELLDPLTYQLEPSEDRLAPPVYRMVEGSDTDARGRPLRNRKDPIRDLGQVRQRFAEAVGVGEPDRDVRIGRNLTSELGIDAARAKYEAEKASDFIEKAEADAAAGAEHAGAPRKPMSRASSDKKDFLGSLKLAEKQEFGALEGRPTAVGSPDLDTMISPELEGTSPLQELVQRRMRALLLHKKQFDPEVDDELLIHEYNDKGESSPTGTKVPVRFWQAMPKPETRTLKNLVAESLGQSISDTETEMRRRPQGFFSPAEIDEIHKSRQQFLDMAAAGAGRPSRQLAWNEKVNNPRPDKESGYQPHTDAWYKQLSAETQIPPGVLRRMDLENFYLVYPDEAPAPAVMPGVPTLGGHIKKPVQKVDAISSAEHAIPANALQEGSQATDTVVYGADPRSGPAMRAHPTSGSGSVKGRIVWTPEGLVRLDTPMSVADRSSHRQFETAEGVSESIDPSEISTRSKTEQLIRGERLIPTVPGAQPPLDPIEPGSTRPQETVGDDYQSGGFTTVARTLYPSDPVKWARAGWRLLPQNELIPVDHENRIYVIGIHPNGTAAVNLVAGSQPKRAGDTGLDTSRFAIVPQEKLPPATQDAIQARLKGKVDEPGLNEGFTVVSSHRGGISTIAYEEAKKANVPVRGRAFGGQDKQGDAQKYGLTAMSKYETAPGGRDVDMIDPRTGKPLDKAAAIIRARQNIEGQDAMLVLTPYMRGHGAKMAPAHVKVFGESFGGGSQEAWRQSTLMGKPAFTVNAFEKVPMEVPLLDKAGNQVFGTKGKLKGKPLTKTVMQWAETPDEAAQRIAKMLIANQVKSLHVEGPRREHLSKKGRKDASGQAEMDARARDVLSRVFTIMREASPKSHVEIRKGAGSFGTPGQIPQVPGSVPGGDRITLGHGPLLAGPNLEGSQGARGVDSALTEPYTQRQAKAPDLALTREGDIIRLFGKYLELKQQYLALKQLEIPDPTITSVKADLEQVSGELKRLRLGTEAEVPRPSAVHRAYVPPLDEAPNPRIVRATEEEGLQARLAQPTVVPTRQRTMTPPVLEGPRIARETIPGPRAPFVPPTPIPVTPDMPAAKQAAVIAFNKKRHMAAREAWEAQQAQRPEVTREVPIPVPAARTTPVGGPLTLPVPTPMPEGTRVQVPPGMGPARLSGPSPKDALQPLVDQHLAEAAADLVRDPEGFNGALWSQRLKTLLKQASDPTGILSTAIAAAGLSSLFAGGDEPEEGPIRQQMATAGIGKIDFAPLKKVLTSLFGAADKVMTEARPHTPSGSSFDALDAGQAKATVQPSQKGGLLETLREGLYDATSPITRRARDVNPALAAKTTEGLHRVIGGAPAAAMEHVERLQPIINDLEDRGLQPSLIRLLNANSVVRAWDTAEQGPLELLRKANALELRNQLTEAGKLRDQAKALERNRASGTVAPGGLTRDQGTKALEALKQKHSPDEYERIQEAADEIERARVSLIDAWEAEGIKTSEEADALRKRKYYVPIRYRDGRYSVDDDAFLVPQQARHAQRRGLSLTDENLVQEFRGANKQLISENPLDAWLAYHQEGWNEVGRNKGAKIAIRDQIREMPDLRWDPKTATGLKPLTEGEKPPDGYDVVTYLEKGKPVRWGVPSSWAAALKIGEPEQMGAIMKGITDARRTVQMTMTTGNPLFLMRNAIRDPQDALLLTPGMTMRHIPEFTRLWKQHAMELAGVKDAKGRRGIPMTEDRALYLKSGAHMSQWSSQLDPEAYLKGDKKLRSKSRLARGLGRIQQANDITERATKETIFKMILQNNKGIAPETAAAWTRKYGGSPDYAVKGSWAGQLSNLINFFNPAIQGSIRTLSAYKNNPAKLKQHMAGMMAGAGVAAGWNKMWKIDHITNEAGQEVPVEGIDDVPESDRNTNLVLLIPHMTETTRDGRVRQASIRIPLGHAARVLYGPMNDLIRGVSGEKSVNPLETLVNTGPGALLPGNIQIDPKKPISSVARSALGSMNPLAKEFLEQWGGKNFRDDRPIVGTRMSETPSRQFNEKTSPTAVLAGQGIGALGESDFASPVRIEHAVRGLGGGLGELSLSAIDGLLKAYRRDYAPVASVSERLSEFPGGALLRPLIEGPGSQKRADAADEFYGALQASGSVIKDANELIRTDPEQARARLATEEYQFAKSIHGPLINIAKQVAQIAQQRALLTKQRAPNMKPMLQQLYLQERALLEYGAKLATEGRQ